jgi:hypothetical protein
MKITLFTIIALLISFISGSQIIGTTYKLDSIEIAQYDLPTEVTWYNAKRECKELGKGWRLPTKEELDEMYNNKDLIGNFVNTNYWSSTEYNSNYAWMQVFTHKLIAVTLKEGHINARAVKTIKNN